MLAITLTLFLGVLPMLLYCCWPSRSAEGGDGAADEPDEGDEVRCDVAAITIPRSRLFLKFAHGFRWRGRTRMRMRRLLKTSQKSRKNQSQRRRRRSLPRLAHASGHPRHLECGKLTGECCCEMRARVFEIGPKRKRPFRCASDASSFIQRVCEFAWRGMPPCVHLPL